MKNINVQVSDEIYNYLMNYANIEEIILLGIRKKKVYDVAKLYQNNMISFGRAAEIAELRQDELALEFSALGIEPLFSFEMVREELSE